MFGFGNLIWSILNVPGYGSHCIIALNVCQRMTSDSELLHFLLLSSCNGRGFDALRTVSLDSLFGSPFVPSRASKTDESRNFFCSALASSPIFSRSEDLIGMTYFLPIKRDMKKDFVLKHKINGGRTALSAQNFLWYCSWLPCSHFILWLWRMPDILSPDDRGHRGMQKASRKQFSTEYRSRKCDALWDGEIHSFPPSLSVAVSNFHLK